jgi:acyl-CoA thioesterase
VTTASSGKYVKSMHTVFPRSATVGAPIDIDVEIMHAGRAFTSATVSASQDGRLCSRALVMASIEEPDLIRHSSPMPDVDGPDDCAPLPDAPAGWDVRTVGDLDISDPATVAPAELLVWSRFPDAPGDPTTGQAMLAYASDGLLIATALLPHAGIGQAMAHTEISTTVIAHTLTFHEPVDASEWLLIAHSSPYAGRGRAYGRADVFGADGRLVASFVQDAMVRAFPEGQGPQSGDRARH